MFIWQPNMESLLCASHCQPLPLFCPRAFRLVMNIWRGLCNSISPHFFAPSEWFEFTAELFALRPSKSHLWKPSSVIILYKKSSFQLPQFSPAGLFNPDRCVLLLPPTTLLNHIPSRKSLNPIAASLVTKKRVAPARISPAFIIFAVGGLPTG